LLFIRFETQWDFWFFICDYFSIKYYYPYPDLKKITSGARETSVSQHHGASLKPFNAIVTCEEFQGALNWAPMVPRDASLFYALYYLYNVQKIKRIRFVHLIVVLLSVWLSCKILLSMYQFPLFYNGIK